MSNESYPAISDEYLLLFRVPKPAIVGCFFGFKSQNSNKLFPPPQRSICQ